MADSFRCPKCKIGIVTQKSGVKGPFIGCSEYWDRHCVWTFTGTLEEYRKYVQAQMVPMENLKDMAPRKEVITGWLNDFIDCTVLLCAVKSFGMSVKETQDVTDQFDTYFDKTYDWTFLECSRELNLGFVGKHSSTVESEAYRLIAEALIAETHGSHFLRVLEAKKAPSEQKQKKEKKMTVKKDKLVRAATHGAKVGLADEAGETVLAMTETMLGAKIEPLLDSPAKRSLAKGLSAAFLMHMTGLISDDRKVQENIENACELVIEAASRDLSQPHVRELRKLGLVLAEFGGKALVEAVKQ